MEKLDLYKTDKIYYQPPAHPVLVELPAYNYLSIVGRGDPDGTDFAKGLQAMYPIAYAIKFAAKAMGKDFTVPKLEGLWWFDNGGSAETVPRSEWNWRLLIRMPDFVDPVMFDTAKAKAIAKKPANQADFDRVEWYTLHEKTVAQMLHVGPFKTEPKTQQAIKAFMAENGYKHAGDHHEIYLSDFSKTPQEKQRTILRYPVAKR